MLLLVSNSGCVRGAIIAPLPEVFHRVDVALVILNGVHVLLDDPFIIEAGRFSDPIFTIFRTVLIFSTLYAHTFSKLFFQLFLDVPLLL